MTEVTALAKQDEQTRPPAVITPMQMLQIAVEQNADLDKLEKLMALQERWERNEARKAFIVAVTAFKAAAPVIVKDTKAHNSDYAALDQICDAVGPVLSAHGLSHRWRIEQEGGDTIRVFCVITHEMGHSEEVGMSGMPDTSGSKNAIQAVASTVSYLERYTLLAVCGLTARGSDRDGGGSSNNEPISADQKEKLIAKMRETSADTAKFLKYHSLSSIDVLPAARFDAAMASLVEVARSRAEREKKETTK